MSAELKAVIEELDTAFSSFKDNHTARLDDLEKKFNRPRVGGGGDDKPDPTIELKASICAWFPNRAGMVDQLDYAAYSSGCRKYLRHGAEVLTPEERKAMLVGIDPEGGYLASAELAREIIRIEHDNSVMRGIARVLPAGAGDVEFPASLTRPEVGWVGETQGRPETDGPDLGKKTFNVKEVYASPKATQRLLDDSSFGIEQFLGEEIGLAFAEEEDAQFIAGDGVIKPRGFTTYTTEATADSAGTRPFGTIEHIATGVSGNWPATDAEIYDKLVDVVHALRPRYRQNARWVMPTTAIARLRKVKDEQKNPIWQPSMAEGTPDRLLGYGVTEAEQMPAVAANSLSVAFGNWRRAYWILDRFGVRVLRDPYTAKPFVVFYTTKRVAGGVADSAALKLLRFAVS